MRTPTSGDDPESLTPHLRVPAAFSHISHPRLVKINTYTPIMLPSCGNEFISFIMSDCAVYKA